MDKENSSLKGNEDTYIITRTEEGAYFVEKDSNQVVISPLFVSEYGARKWLHYQFANDMLQHRVYQFGMDCLYFLEGDYFWQCDMDDGMIGPIFDDYYTALKWRWFLPRSI
jgi:hypothetical protein